MISLCTRQDFRVRREESTHHERSRRPIQRGITVAGLASTLITRRHDARRVRGVHTTRYHAEPGRPCGTQIGTARIRRRNIGPLSIPGDATPLETARKHIAAAISPTTSYTVPEDVRTALATRSASQTADSGLTEESSVSRQSVIKAKRSARGTGSRPRSLPRPLFRAAGWTPPAFHKCAAASPLCEGALAISLEMAVGPSCDRLLQWYQLTIWGLVLRSSRSTRVDAALVGSALVVSSCHHS